MQRVSIISRAAYVDLNRANLFEIVGLSERPIMSLGGRGTFDEFGTYPTSVIRHGDEIRAYYGSWTRCLSVPFDVAIGYAISHDGGVTFEKQGSGPVLSASLHEPFVISGPKIRRFGDRWYLWYIAGTKWIPHRGARRAGLPHPHGDRPTTGSAGRGRIVNSFRCAWKRTNVRRALM